MQKGEEGLRKKLERWNKLYAPHQFNKEGLKKWQSKSAKNIAFSKIQTAIAVLIEQNPTFQFFQRTDQDKPLIPLWNHLLEYIADVGKSYTQLKKFFFNLSKDGTAIGQVYWKYETREVKYEKSYDIETDVSEYEKKTIEDFNNPYWTVLERKDVYIDEQATSWNPTDEHPIRDWFKRVIYDEVAFKTRFPKSKYPNVDKCNPGGELSNDGTNKTLDVIGKDQYEVLFYENIKDEFSILCNGILLRDRPLPYKHKQLSIFGAKWFEKPESIDGIGICEAIENDEAMIDALSNARLDQIILDIYKVLKIGYGEELEDDEMELEPNKILRLRDPNSAQWMTSSNVGREPFNEESVIKSDIEEKTGINKEIIGNIPQRRQTATESAISREAALRRLKTPLDNVEEAMEIKERLMIGITSQIYSIPTKKELDEKGMEVLESYRKVRLPLEKEKGEYEESTEENIFEITPDELMNTPDIKVKHMSMMPVSKALIRQEKLQFYSLISQNPYTDAYKAYRNLSEAFEEDPEDWMKSENDIIKEQQEAKQTMVGDEGVGDTTGGKVATPTEGGTAEIPAGGGEQSTFKKFFQKLTGRAG